MTFSIFLESNSNHSPPQLQYSIILKLNIILLLSLPVRHTKQYTAVLGLYKGIRTFSHDKTIYTNIHHKSDERINHKPFTVNGSLFTSQEYPALHAESVNRMDKHKLPPTRKWRGGMFALLVKSSHIHCVSNSSDSATQTLTHKIDRSVLWKLEGQRQCSDSDRCLWVGRCRNFGAKRMDVMSPRKWGVDWLSTLTPSSRESGRNLRMRWGKKVGGTESGGRFWSHQRWRNVDKLSGGQSD